MNKTPKNSIVFFYSSSVNWLAVYGIVKLAINEQFLSYVMHHEWTVVLHFTINIVRLTLVESSYDFYPSLCLRAFVLVSRCSCNWGRKRNQISSSLICVLRKFLVGLSSLRDASRVFFHSFLPLSYSLTQAYSFSSKVIRHRRPAKHS